MKKVSYFLMAALLVAANCVFVSCGKDDVEAAKITFDNVDGSTVTLAKGVTSYTVNATITSTENLKTVKVFKEVGANSSQIGKTIDSFDPKTSYNLKQEITDITEEIKVRVSVDNGTETSSTLTIKITSGGVDPEPDPVLDAEADFTWTRVGGGSATGLDTYGLTWSSQDGSFITVKPLTNAKLIELTTADLSSITTKEALQEKVDGVTTGLTEYKKIPMGNKTVDLVIATKTADNVYYLINVKSTTDDGATTPTRKVIGKYRK